MALAKKTRKKSKSDTPTKKKRLQRKKSEMQPSLKIQIDLSEESRLGPGKIRLLEAIDKAGSLSQGAAEMGISYRRAWLFMTQINETFDKPAIATSPGGRGGAPSQLTDFGRELITTYRKMEMEAERAASKGMSWILEHRR